MAQDDFKPKLGRIRDTASNAQLRTNTQMLRETGRAGARAVRQRGHIKSAMAKRGMGAGVRAAAGLIAPGSRRVIVKARYTRIAAGDMGAARAHLNYIQRDGVTREGEAGRLYDAQHDDVDGRAFLERSEKDPHQFRFIVSAEDSARLPDLKPLIRDLLAQMERDLDTKVDWVAVDHFNTGHPHTHVVIRGRDDRGQDLVMARDYIGHGVRARAQALVTLELGPETQLERIQKLFDEVGQERLTHLDRQLMARAKDNILVITATEENDPTQRTLRIGRLRTLQRLGLASERQAGVWSLDANAEAKLRQLGDRADKFKMMQRALKEAGIERGAAAMALFERGPRRVPLVGKVVGVGTVDEITDRTWVIIDVKFIISDHPVTIYNHAVPPGVRLSAYPNDPTIALRASQTIFPLNRDFSLILTNLEYAQDPSTPPCDKRTFARNYRSSMVRTDAFVRTRKLSNQEVTRVNYVLKARARRYIAAGRKEWLFPEQTVSGAWGALRETFLPPERGLWHFGGEMAAKFEDGHVHYQDEFGRTEKERDFLKKDLPASPLRAGDWCGCGSGLPFKSCCKPKPIVLRRTWSEQSIRERNLMLLNGIVRILELDKGKDWVRVRRDMTDKQIRTIYLLYEGLWPRETDLFQLLPKPDGVARAVYTGSIHPKTITEFALGAALYFGELIIEHPFLHAGTVRKEFSPVENSKTYRQEVLKTILFFLQVMPLVEAGLVNLVPDPCNFDLHLRDQMLHMANARAAGTQLHPSMEPRLEEIVREDAQRSRLLLPPDTLKAQVRKASPGLSVADLERVLEGVEQLKERDPLAVLQEGSLAGGKEGGQFRPRTQFFLDVRLEQ